MSPKPTRRFAAAMISAWSGGHTSDSRNRRFPCQAVLEKPAVGRPLACRIQTLSAIDAGGESSRKQQRFLLWSCCAGSLGSWLISMLLLWAVERLVCRRRWCCRVLSVVSLLSTLGCRGTRQHPVCTAF